MLLYGYKGAITWSDVMRMSVADRKWFIRRLDKQLEMEREEFEKMKSRHGG